MGQRLDRFLADQCPDLSRSRLQQLIGEGQVQINDQICQTKKQILQRGDRLELRVPAAIPLDIEPETMDLDILFEDEQLLVLNKPAGLVVHPAPGHFQGTLVHGLLAHCPNLGGIGGVQRPGIVHRLDKDTTGVMVVAKTDRALGHLQGQLKTRTMQRQYLGVVYGTPKTQQGTIDLAIGRHPGDRKKMAVVPPEKGRSAVTHWQIKASLAPYHLIHFRLETGRTHQIRVHAAHMGWPIVGDPLYGHHPRLRVKVPGQVLHAQTLTLIHPISEHELIFEAPLPQHFSKVLAYLGLILQVRV